MIPSVRSWFFNLSSFFVADNHIIVLGRWVEGLRYLECEISVPIDVLTRLCGSGMWTFLSCCVSCSPGLSCFGLNVALLFKPL